MTSRWKLIVSLLGIFVLGGITGSLLMLRFGPIAELRPQASTTENVAPEKWGPQQFRNFVYQLDLTPDQAEDVRIVIDQEMLELEKVRREARIDTAKILDRMHAEIEPLLTPEQIARLNSTKSQQTERFRRWWEERAKRLRTPPAPK